MNLSKKTAVIFSILGLAAGTAGSIALQTKASNGNMQGNRGMMGQFAKPAAAATGEVISINGKTITIKNNRTGISYAVDATSAAFEKISVVANGNKTSSPPTPTVITIADVKVGDHLMVAGTVSGTNVAATKVTVGQVGQGFGRGGMRGAVGESGTVAAINGNTITLTGKDGITYTVNASSASVKKVTTIAVGDIAVGDTLMVSGEKSGTTITAKNIMDGQMPPFK